MLLWCWLVGAAFAGGDGARVFDAARLAPADIDLLVCVQDASELRKGEMGPAATAMALHILGEGEATRAWSALAERLGWTGEEAFDRLLGSRVTLLRRGGDSPKGATWALLSEVSLDTEKRLREKLDVAPRAIVAGHTVLSVERGAYELSAERRAKYATLILAPADGNGLFDELLPLLANGPAEPLSATPTFAEVRALGGGQLLVFARMPEGKGAWTGLVARREGMRVVAGLVAGPRPDDGAICEVEPWDRGPATAAGDQALFWSIERSLPDAFEMNSVSAALAEIPILRLRERAADLLGDFLGVWVTPSENGLPAIAAALEVQDIERAPAPADAMMAELLGAVGLERVDFGGVAPAAVRVVDLGASAVIRESGLWAEGPTARWRFADGAEGGPAKAWWIMGVGEGAFDLAGMALGEGRHPVAAPGDERSWVELGGAKPAAALEALRSAGQQPAGPMLAASLVGDVRWAIEVAPGPTGKAEDPRLRGSIEALMVCPKAGKAAPGTR